MRVVYVIALLMVTGCASERLALAPPPGVDFSGRWKLNEADSDDPQRVAQSQNAASANNQAASGGSGGQGGRGGGRGGRGAPGMGGYGAGPMGPAVPGMGALSDGLHWPGKELEIKQVAGIVTIASMGTNQVYQPAAGKPPRPQAQRGDDGGSQGRDVRVRDRGDGPPPVCGWDGKTLVVESENPDDERPPFEERFGLSDDGQRLIEVVAFKGGRSGGFTVSRVWDRVLPGASPDANSDAIQGVRAP